MMPFSASSTIRIGIYGTEEKAPAGRGVGLWNSGLEGTLTAAEAVPVFLDQFDEDEPWKNVLAGLHGVVFTGWKCNDAPHSPFAQEGLCHWCRDHNLPLLAIDDGMLVLNSAFGGSNHLDLARELPEALQHRHRPEPGSRHAILVEPRTMLCELYGEGEIVVNSEHTKGVSRVAQGFRIGARALDGVIEAIEWEASAWFCMGVQWQPASSTASGLDIQLFRGLVEAGHRRASKQSRAPKRMAIGA
jgi:gamma-glutamyl-gamma-aminobutyrate hydrolase PuuD